MYLENAARGRPVADDARQTSPGIRPSAVPDRLVQKTSFAAIHLPLA